jgi:hypothetical protein
MLLVNQNRRAAMAKLFRYRKPSAKTLLGVTKAKKAIKKQTGYYAATKATRAIPNAKRRVKRKAGYESEPMKRFRWLRRLFK